MFTEIINNHLNGFLSENKDFVGLSKSLQQKLETWDLEKKPIERIKWCYYFLSIAYLTSLRSPDARTKHGTVLVNENKSIIGTGYNGYISNIEDRILPNYLSSKYPFMIHSELSAILNCAKNGISTNNSTAYLTGAPCFNCSQLLYQSGIKFVYHGNKSSKMIENDEYKENMELFKWLTQNSMPIMHINFGEEDLKELLK